MANFLSIDVYDIDLSEVMNVGRDQRADDCEPKLAEPGYKISHHGVAN
jgi:hypothetical protein